MWGCQMRASCWSRRLCALGALAIAVLMYFLVDAKLASKRALDYFKRSEAAVPVQTEPTKPPQASTQPEGGRLYNDAVAGLRSSSGSIAGLAGSTSRRPTAATDQLQQQRQQQHQQPLARNSSSSRPSAASSSSSRRPAPSSNTSSTANTTNANPTNLRSRSPGSPRSTTTLRAPAPEQQSSSRRPPQVKAPPSRSTTNTTYLLSRNSSSSSSTSSRRTPEPVRQNSSKTSPEARPYKPVIHIVGRECLVQAREFRYDSGVKSAEECDARTADTAECSAFFMWSETRPYWSCRCCEAFGGEAGGSINKEWNVYKVQSPRVARRQPPSTTLPPAVTALTVPLYSRGQRCRKQVGTFHNARTVADCAKLAAQRPICGPLFMFSAEHLDWGCRCCSRAGLELEPSTLPAWDIYMVLPNGTQLPRPRLYMIAITSQKSIHMAEELERSMRRRMDPTDRLVHVCGRTAAPTARKKLVDVLQMPDMVTDSLKVIRECGDKGGAAWVCLHRMGAMKFVFGLVHEVRRLKASGYPMPLWWIVKDDDTYVHIPNLMRALNQWKGGKPLWQQPASFGRRGPGCPGVCGGAGWILSGPLAEELVEKHGDRYLAFSAERIVNGPGHYDIFVPPVVEWTGQTLVDLPEMNEFSPVDKRCNETVGGNRSACHPWRSCTCLRSPYPATWHLKGGSRQALELLESDA
uniref:Uncharacterized protein n=1 Tax=Alexandrium monilatum TaxID=311494 RepID=A0A7S4QRF9_9DINO